LYRSTSISNVAGASLSRRSSERELADSGAKKRTSSSTDRHDGEFKLRVNNRAQPTDRTALCRPQKQNTTNAVLNILIKIWCYTRYIYIVAVVVVAVLLITGRFNWLTSDSTSFCPSSCIPPQCMAFRLFEIYVQCVPAHGMPDRH